MQNLVQDSSMPIMTKSPPVKAKLPSQLLNPPQTGPGHAPGSFTTFLHLNVSSRSTENLELAKCHDCFRPQTASQQICGAQGKTTQRTQELCVWTSQLLNQATNCSTKYFLCLKLRYNPHTIISTTLKYTIQYFRMASELCTHNHCLFQSVSFTSKRDSRTGGVAQSAKPWVQTLSPTKKKKKKKLCPC
jgi:hypothetical protein